MAPEQFEFPTLPVEPVRAGTTLLVTAPGRLGSRLARELALGGGHDDGIVYISTNNSGRSLAEDCQASYPDLDFSRFGIIDATGRGDIETTTEARVESVSNTGDLTGISIKNSILTTHLQKNGIDRIRSCFDSLSMLLLYTNFKTITRFVHTMAGRISATDGFGLFVLDPSMHDPQVRYTLQNVCGGVIDVRNEESGPELRVEGLPDQSGEWQSVDL
jgi:KaiC/GvpD/RAD55 family RecA-like ATPase